MKRMRHGLLVLLLFMGSTVIFPCGIVFEPQEVKVVKGKETQVKIFVRLKHGNCPLPLKETVLVADGVVIKKMGSWEKVEANLYRMDLVIVLNKARGEIRAARECDRRGTFEAVLKVSI